MNNTWINVISLYFNAGHYEQMFQPNSVPRPMVIGTIDLYNFNQGTVILNVVENQVSGKPGEFIISQTSQLIKMNFDVVMKQSKINTLIHYF